MLTVGAGRQYATISEALQRAPPGVVVEVAGGRWAQARCRRLPRLSSLTCQPTPNFIASLEQAEDHRRPATCAAPFPPAGMQRGCSSLRRSPCVRRPGKQWRWCGRRRCGASVSLVCVALPSITLALASRHPAATAAATAIAGGLLLVLLLGMHCPSDAGAPHPPCAGAVRSDGGGWACGGRRGRGAVGAAHPAQQPLDCQQLRRPVGGRLVAEGRPCCSSASWRPLQVLAEQGTPC